MRLSHFVRKKRAIFCAVFALFTPLLGLFVLVLINDHFLPEILSPGQLTSAQGHFVAPYLFLLYWPYFLLVNMFPTASSCDGCFSASAAFVAGLLATWIYHAVAIRLVWIAVEHRENTK